MSLRPIIVIGCGGSGGKVVIGLRKRMQEELERRAWTRGIPSAFQFKWIDVPSDPEREPDFGPPLPLGDYVPLATVGTYRDYDGALVFRAGSARLDRLTGWRPTPHLAIPVDQGAGQMRAVGRAVAIAKADLVAKTIQDATAAVAAGRSDLDLLAAHLREGADGVEDASPSEPYVVVVSSLAGGTGAGIFMDVCDLVRATNPGLSNRIFGVLFTAEVFRQVSMDGGMPANTVAALSEMMSGFLSMSRTPEPIFNVAGTMATVGISGPAYPYIVGLQPLGGGAPLESPAECYRAVTETLLATMLDESMQRDFLNYDTTNFIPHTNTAQRATPWGMVNESPGGGVAPKCGAVSSFGSAKVSVGSARFGNWAQDRMARTVINYITEGWRARGLEFFDPSVRATTTDVEIVQYLVARDREVFFERCGLYEEDEPDGTPHDHVLEGILSTDTLKQHLTNAKNKVVNELQPLGSQTESSWKTSVLDLVRLRESNILGTLNTALDEAVRSYADQVVPAVGSAVAEWMAGFGLPVTVGLVRETRDQCQTAAAQIRDAANTAGQNAVQDVAAAITPAFQGLGNGKCNASSGYVEQAVRRALGPITHKARRARLEVAAALLDDVITKVLEPVIAELDQVSRDLSHPSFVQRVQGWPDGAGVSDVYAPPPSEFCLVTPESWDKKYRELLTASGGSADEVRSLIGAGGFQYGPPLERRTAPVAVLFGKESWFGRDGRMVTVSIALRPDDVLERTRQWFRDESTPMGRFIAGGLSDYLAREGRDGLVADHLNRLDAFRSCLSRAIDMAQPLFRISDAMMQRVHPGKERRSVLNCQKFPFPPDHPAREIVDSVLFNERKPEGGWCTANTAKSVESVLMMSRLSAAVHPSAVASLYQPIAQRWNNIVNAGGDVSSAIDGFWTCNRARLLTESIPLPQPSIEAIIRGWFVGRLLGMVTAPSPAAGPAVRSQDSFGRPTVAAMPWPLLRHGKQKNLYQDNYRLEWLPALLEHLGLAMMLVGQDEHILDGYESLFQFGKNSSEIFATWITEGSTPGGDASGAQVKGSSAEERREALSAALTTLIDGYEQRQASAAPNLVDRFESFMTIPYGHELSDLVLTQLGELHGVVKNQSIAIAFG